VSESESGPSARKAAAAAHNDRPVRGGSTVTSACLVWRTTRSRGEQEVKAPWGFVGDAAPARLPCVSLSCRVLLRCVRCAAARTKPGHTPAGRNGCGTVEATLVRTHADSHEPAYLCRKTTAAEVRTSPSIMIIKLLGSTAVGITNSYK
jgi:hypothetical protein